jgi:hypothetical protein
MTETEEQELRALRAALLLGMRVEIPSVNPGYAAFERHQLLAIRFHRASRLNAPELSERKGWLQYFDEHFPRGGAHGLILWEDWRGRLVKDEFPGKRVTVSHGQPHAHWRLDSGQRLFINLESMWEDFERSVAAFTELLASDDERRGRTLEKWRRRQWSVQQIVFDEQPGMTTTSTASASRAFSAGVASSSAWHPSDEET